MSSPVGCPLLTGLLGSLVLFTAGRGGGDEDACLEDLRIGQHNVDACLMPSDILQLPHVRPSEVIGELIGKHFS